MKRLAISLALGVGLVFSSLAAGTNYSWKGTAGGNWTNTANWTQAGYPQAGDDANFTGTVAQTVTIATGNQTVNNLSVTGSATWIWNPSAGSVLNLSGTLTYEGPGTNSQIAVPVYGDGTLVMNHGQLYLCPASPLTNGFSGVVVNGGTLTSGRYGIPANSNNFGNPSAIIQVGALSGTNDAMVEFGNKAIGNFPYTQPIVIRAGSTGRATLRYYNAASGWGYGSTLAGGITLFKDVHLASDYHNGFNWWRHESGNLNVSGPITGTGNVYIDDLYNVLLTGPNSYTGQTIVNANNVWLWSSNNTFAGAITIARGYLYAASDAAFGAVANTVTLGGPGTLGALAMNTNLVGNVIASVNRAITLAGNGGIISSWNNARPFLYGPITGAGKLIVAHDMEQGVFGAMYGANDYSGGTLVVDGCMRGGTNTAFGTGDIEIKVNGSIGIHTASNLGAGTRILVRRNPLMDNCGRSGGEIGLYTDTVPNIDTNSNGKLAIYFSGSTNVNAWLANGAQPIGDGTMFLCSYNATVSATGLAALVANDPTHTYRLGTSAGDVNNSLWLNSSGTTVGALADIGGQSYNVQVGRPNIGSVSANAVSTYDDNNFSGLLTVYPETYIRFSMLPGASANCMGATNGNVALYGHQNVGTLWRSLWIENSAGVGRTVRKNDLAFNGSAYLWVDAASGTPAYTTIVQVATLTRNDRSTFGLRGYRGFLGDRERFTVTGGVPSNNGMVAPWMWSDRDGTFLDYGAAGFVSNLWDGTTLAGATSVSKISLAGAEQIPAAGVSVYALRTTNNYGVLANGGAVLTNTSGGVLLLGVTSTNEPPMDFGANEAVVITRGSGLHFFNGPLTGSGGLTKTGYGTLVLNADNTALTGGIVVNQGALYYTNWVHLGANPITLNGGSLLLLGIWTAATSPRITNDIILGPCGGTLGNVDNGGNGRYYGSISGSGWVQIVSRWGYNLYGVSTYTGGTYTERMSALNLYTNDALGTGPLCMGVGSGTTLNNCNSVKVYHDRALNTNTFVELKTRSSWLYLASPNPKLGSVEGNGFITLDNARATFGLDNRDAEFVGQIEQQDPLVLGHIVKDGTGTWSLWGMVTIRGSVTVTNGTLRVNNWVNPAAPVYVYPGATLDGIGNVGIVSNLGGTVKGNLIMQQLSLGSNSVLQVALNGPGVGQYDVTTVNGALNLTGGALALTLGFKPTPGQTFTILNNAGGSISGQFASGQIVSGTYNGQAYGFRISYDSGNNIVLTALSRGTAISIY